MVFKEPVELWDAAYELELAQVRSAREAEYLKWREMMLSERERYPRSESSIQQFRQALLNAIGRKGAKCIESSARPSVETLMQLKEVCCFEFKGRLRAMVGFYWAQCPSMVQVLRACEERSILILDEIQTGIWEGGISDLHSIYRLDHAFESIASSVWGDVEKETAANIKAVERALACAVLDAGKEAFPWRRQLDGETGGVPCEVFSQACLAEESEKANSGPARRATQKEIAVLAGCTVRTVRRCEKDPSSVSWSMRRRIENAKKGSVAHPVELSQEPVALAGSR